MKLKKVLSLLLALVMTVSLLTLPAHAENAATEEETATEETAPAVNFTNVAPLVQTGAATSAAKALRKASSMAVGATYALANDASASSDAPDGLVMNKTATANANGTYTITLEAYATGEKIISEVTEDVPTDIVLVLDQSGSMAEVMTYTEAYPDSHDGTYYVYVTPRQGNPYYQAVTWCDRCNAWTDGCEYGYHYGSTKYTPKTSATDTTAGRVQFYSGITRLQALKNAVTTFASSVAAKAAGADGDIATTEDNVNHRIAVVGFASGYYWENGRNSAYYYYGNTEVFVGGTQYTYNAGSTNDATATNSAQSHYGEVFQSMNTTEGQANITASIGALAANGGTLTNLGMEMANGILNENSVQTGEKRNRVVVVFTDGQPGWSGYDSSTANAAIMQANTVKSKDVTVYTVGIFDGADATSAGNQNGSDIQKSNWFMQNLSSNNGTVQNPSYYLSASDADALKTIFKQISEQIETGGSSTKLDKKTVIKDEVSSYFTLPAGATEENITLETYACTGKDGDSNYTWSKNAGAKGAAATVDGATVSVTGFDFAENYVGTVTENGNVTYRGNKLVISFTVTRRSGFLGGNDVPTNGSAGIYENADAQTPVGTFGQPKVNVPIEPVTVTAENKNVYLLGDLTAEQLKDGAVVKCGDVTLNLAPTATNYGLKAWQTAYVKITVEVKDANGNVITGLTNLTDDTTYTISVTVEPKTDGTDADGTPATAKTRETAPANVYVFKPALTFKDSEVYYGDNAPADYDSNKVSELWKHGDTLATAVTMTGTKPTLTLAYTPGKGIADGIINTTNDIPVAVTAKIDSTDVTSHVTFGHEACNPTCGWTVPTTKGDPAFLLHVKTCTLTVRKVGWDSRDANQSFIFKVTGDDGNGVTIAPITVTVQQNGSATITGLPVGAYTVTEVGNWSWRYTAQGKASATLRATAPAATATITNDRTNGKWLSGDNYAINYVGGIKVRGTFAGN